MKIVLFLLSVSCMFAQNLVELRVASNQYRYADWNKTFKNSVVTDVFYIGVPGTNEANLGLGYQFKLRSLTLIPVTYVTSAKEGPQAAVKFGLIGGLEAGQWKSGFYLARLQSLQRGYEGYQVLDTLDVTRKLGKRWELGGSFGLFHQDGKWNPQLGPLVRLNDKRGPKDEERGSWGFSFRVGTDIEARFIRTWTF